MKRAFLFFFAVSLMISGCSVYDTSPSGSADIKNDLDKSEDFFTKQSHRFPLPEGFALEHRKGCLVYALSPEGCRFVFKKIKNYPKKDALFWADALKDHFIRSGYIPEKEIPMFAHEGDGGRRFFWKIEGSGGSSYSYMTAFVVRGKKIFVAASGGEEDIFKDYAEKVSAVLSYY